MYLKNWNISKLYHNFSSSVYIYLITGKQDCISFHTKQEHINLETRRGRVGVGRTSRCSSPSFSKSGCRKFSYLSISLLPAARIVKCASRACRFSPVHPGLWFEHRSALTPIVRHEFVRSDGPTRKRTVLQFNGSLSET